jgi:hypothetical protein
MTRATFGLTDAELSRVLRTSEVARSALNGIEQNASISRLATLGIQAAGIESFANSPAMKSLTQGSGKAFLDVDAAKFANTAQVSQLATLGIKAAAIQSFANSPAFKNLDGGLGKAFSDAHTTRLTKMSFAAKIQTDGIGKSFAALAGTHTALLDGMLARPILSDAAIKALLPDAPSMSRTFEALWPDMSQTFKALTALETASWASARAQVESLDVDPAIWDEMERAIADDLDAELAIEEAVEAVQRRDSGLSREAARRYILRFAWCLYVSVAAWALLVNPLAAGVVIAATGFTPKDAQGLARYAFDALCPPDKPAGG